jgi:methylmalonyl-CoA mutase
VKLATEFEAHDEAAWRALAEKALKGGALETLTAHTLDQISVKPLYGPGDEDAGRLGAAPFARGLVLLPASPAWDICQLHWSADPAETNRQILTDLEGGASTIALRIAAPEQAGLAVAGVEDLARALEGVHLDFIRLDLEPGIHFATSAETLQAVWSERGFAADALKGGFGADPLGACARAGGLDQSFEDSLAAAAALARLTNEQFPGVTALLADGRPYHDGGASEAQELACLAATLAAYLRAMEVGGLSPEQGLSQIALALACDADLFLSIAKLRAARMLLARIAEACGAQKALTGVRITAQTSARMMTRLDPDVNMLRTTAACTAAALGGADAISVLPYGSLLGQPDAFMRRIARNSQLILQEESHLGRVVDAPGGSWYVEALSYELAAKAWELFQEIESKGGLAAALAQGAVQAELAKSAESRADALATSQNELIGINAFPHLAESIPALKPNPLPEPLDDPAVTVEPVPLRRPALVFERLRNDAEAYAKTHGHRLQVFLANLGERAGFAARANYARNLFASGGIEALDEGGYDSAEAAAKAFKASGAPIVCLCGSDEAYDALAQTAAAALKGAGADLIALAGRPGEARAVLGEAGIALFIHKGANVVEALTRAHDAAGVTPQ